MLKEQTKPRRMKIMKKNFIIHGFTPGCGGCRESEAGRSPRGHSPTCRERFEELLRNDPIKIEADERTKSFQEATTSEPDKKSTMEKDKMVKSIRSTVAKTITTKKKHIHVDVNINIENKSTPGKWLLQGTRTDRTCD